MANHMQRQRGFIPWAVVDRQLRALRSIWASTTQPDGRPHAVPIWFTWDGRTLYFGTHQGAQKARNLERQPWVVIHAGDRDDVIILEGMAELVADPTELRKIDAARGEKYVAPRTGARDTILVEGTIMYRLSPRHVMAWEYGDVSTRTDWRPSEGDTDPDGG